MSEPENTYWDEMSLENLQGLRQLRAQEYNRAASAVTAGRLGRVVAGGIGVADGAALIDNPTPGFFIGTVVAFGLAYGLHYLQEHFSPKILPRDFAYQEVVRAIDRRIGMNTELSQ
jgi:hypothetical protein